MSPKSMKYRQLKLFTFSNDMQMHSFINTFHISKVDCKQNENEKCLFLLAMKVFNLPFCAALVMRSYLEYETFQSVMRSVDHVDQSFSRQNSDFPFLVLLRTVSQCRHKPSQMPLKSQPSRKMFITFEKKPDSQV